MKKILVLLLILIPVSMIQAENEIIQNFQLSFSTFSEMDNLEDTSWESAFLWEPEVYAYGENMELYFQPKLWFPMKSTDESYIDIKELKLSWFPSGSITLDAGQYQHESSFAAFFGQTDFFKVTDYTALIQGDFEDASIPSWLIDLTFYWNNVYLRGSIEPFREDIPFFSPNSPWFPNLGFPEEIASPFAPDGKIELESIYLLQPVGQDSLTELQKNMGGALEFGGSTGLFDFLFLLYRGRDTAPLFAAEVVLQGLFEDYTVELHPLEERITAFGAAVRTTAGPFVFYEENSFLWNKPFLRDTYYATPSGFQTETYTSPYFGITVGGRFEGWKANLIAAAEYTNGFNLEELYGTVMPFFQQMSLANLTWSPFEGRFQFSLTGITAFEDGSTALNCGIRFSPGEGETFFSISTPLFLGTEDSVFGQYRNILYPTFRAGLRL